MSLISEKARFYIEQSVPELREWERKEIFNSDEIRNISRQRSDFEHILAGRGSSPNDYTRYVVFEKNVASLVKKRAQKKRTKLTPHTAQRRIVNIFERGTRKWHGNLALRMQYLEYCNSTKSNKKLQKVLTETLRLFPKHDRLWIWAAEWYFNVPGDLANARACLQRGLRFCPSSWDLYIAYARVEMRYVARIVGRRQILGIDQNDLLAEKQHNTTTDGVTLELSDTELEQQEGHIDISGAEKSVDRVLQAIVPMTIFDAAMQRSKHDASVASEFFDMFCEFYVAPARNAASHVLEDLQASSPGSIETRSCLCRLPLTAVSPASAQFPSALRDSIRAIRSAFGTASPSDKGRLAALILKWFQPLASMQDVDQDVQQVASAIIRQVSRHIEEPE